MKENQGHLFEVDDTQYSYVRTVNKEHGRLETRECWVTDKEEYLSLLHKHHQCMDLKTIVRTISQRELGEELDIQARYFISSLSADAQAILETKRSH